MRKATIFRKLQDAYTLEAWTRVATLREEIRQILRYEEEEFRDLFACLWEMLKEEKEEYADWPD